MKNLIKNLLNIREGEGTKTFLMFAYIFLIIGSLVIMKPIRTSLFLTRYGIEQLPYVFVLVAPAALIFIRFYSRFVNKIRLNFLIFNTHLVFISLLILFWILLYTKFEAGWLLYAFFVYVGIFGLASTSQFWLLANYVFDAREAKRLFSILGAGGISGGIFGGYLDKILAPIFGTDNMLFFCLLFWFICMIILKIIWKQAARYNYKEILTQQQRVQRHRSSGTNPLSIIFNSKHLLFLAAVVAIAALVSALVDYQYAYIASAIIVDKDELTAFFGLWLSNLSIISLVVQFLFTSRILKHFGVTTSLFFLPFGILIGAVSVLFTPALWSAIAIKVGEGSFKQSIYKAGMELLYLPIPSIEKNQAKAFIDISVDSFATGAGGLLLILFANQLGFTVQQISILLFLLLTIWIYLILRVKKEYINSFRYALEKRTIDLEDQNLNVNDAAIFESITRILEGKNERQILYALQLLENINNEEFIPYFQKLLDHPSSEIRYHVLLILQTYKGVNLSPNIKHLVEDVNHNVRVEAIRYLIQRATDDVNLALQYFTDSEFNIITAALMSIAFEYKENQKFRGKIDFRKLLDEFIMILSESTVNEMEKVYIKTNIAKVLGIVSEVELDPLLFNYLFENSIEVKKAAIESAGNIRNMMYIPALIRLLENKFVRKNVRLALAAFGEDIVDQLDPKFDDEKLSVQLRANFFKIFPLVGSQRTVEILVKYLNHSNNIFRFEALKALNKLRTKFPLLDINPDIVKEQVLKETVNYHNILSALSGELNMSSQDNRDNHRIITQQLNIQEARKLLIKALHEKLDGVIERIFRLLGLIYPAQDLYNSYLGMVSTRANLKANAIEFLDNILDTTLKEVLIPIMDNYSSARHLDHPGTALEKSKVDELQVMERIFESEDNWLKICGLYLVSQLRKFESLNFLKKLAEDPDQRVREAADQALNNLQ
jgi:AAA family ATP:ADP antiporter